MSTKGKRVTYETVIKNIADVYHRLEKLGEDFRSLYGVSGKNLQDALKKGSERLGIANTMILTVFGELDDAKQKDVAAAVAAGILADEVLNF